MASDEASLLEAIWATPDDDAPRLVYADFLTERGDPRGELIQVECALERALPFSERWWSLRSERQSLWTAHHATWSATPLGSVDRGYHRGFGVEATLSAERFIELKGALDLPTPAISRLTLHSGTPARLETIVQSKWLTRYEHLEIRSNLSHSPLSTPGAKALASAALPALRSLSAITCRFGPMAAKALAKAPWLAQLERLSLTNNSLGVKGIAALVASPLKVRRLSLSSTFVDGADEALRLLAAWPGLAHVEVLSLAANRSLGDEGLRALAGSPHAKALRALDVSGGRITEVGIRAVLELPRLEAMNVQRATPLEPELAQALKTRFGPNCTP